MIVGGGDSAVDWAFMLKDIAREVILIHRRDQFRAHPQSVQELLASSVEVKCFYEFKAIHGGTISKGSLFFTTRQAKRHTARSMH